MKDARHLLPVFIRDDPINVSVFFMSDSFVFLLFIFWVADPDPRDGFEKEEYVSILLESETLPLSRFGGEPLTAGDNQLMLLNRSSSTSCIIHTISGFRH